MLPRRPPPQQHKRYVAGYEVKRYHDLFARLSTRYLFLRINPDAFTDTEGRRVDPPFTDRVCEARACLDALLVRAEHGSFTDEDPLVIVQHLFYDGRRAPSVVVDRDCNSKRRRLECDG